MDEPSSSTHNIIDLELQELLQSAFNHVQQAVIKSNNLPRDLSHKLYSNHRDFRQVTNTLSRNALELSNFLLSFDHPKVNFTHGEFENNFEKLVDINNDEVDKIQLKVELATKGKGDNEIINKPVLTMQKNSNHLIMSSNMKMPQLKFTNKIDNSHNPWKPIIKYKPHSIQPLQFTPVLYEDGEQSGFSHPYQPEIDNYKPPKTCTVPDVEELVLPPPIESTKPTYVCTQHDLQCLMFKLHNANEIAIDLEHHSQYTYQGFTCLMQISIVGEDFIIDTLKLRDKLYLLNEIFTDPTKLKVFHGATNDILWLQRDFGVYVVGLFDTYVASFKLHFKEKKLVDLLRRFCNTTTDKKYQLADWRIRPLPTEMLTYAQLDTHYLIFIWRQLKKMLLEKDPSGETLLEVFEISKQVCLGVYHKPIFLESNYLEIYKYSGKTLNSRQLYALKLLYKWRDENARKLDISVDCLMSRMAMIKLAEQLPNDIKSAAKCYDDLSHFAKQNITDVVKLLNSVRDCSMEQEEPVNTLASTMKALQHSESAGQTEVLQALSSDVTAQKQPLATVLPYTPDPNNDIKMDLTCNIYTKAFLPPYERYKCYLNLVRVQKTGKLAKKGGEV